MNSIPYTQAAPKDGFCEVLRVLDEFRTLDWEGVEKELEKVVN